MFRARSSEECEALYNMINQARINNPTYIALQNARGPYAEDTWAAAMDRRNAERTEGSTEGGSSWWGSLGRRNSYRAKSTRALSTSAGTGSSVNTIGSAFSALKRFGASGKLFNGRGSLYSSNQDSHSRSTDSLTGEVETSSGTSPRTQNSDDPMLDSQGMPLGILNTKIRLYARESQQKWRDMGAARLSVMRPSPPASPNANPYVRQGPGSPGQRNPETEKRIVVLGKTKSETLLDVTLSETCFERVARTGIAVSVWEDTVGMNGEVGGIPAIGGVAATKARVYMIQVSGDPDGVVRFRALVIVNSF
ncbi:putative srm splicing coactivator [Diplodia seriata]|nr:putative srm splicing coactivator [Diplodia seriata]